MNATTSAYALLVLVAAIGGLKGCRPGADYDAATLLIRSTRVVDVRDGSLSAPMDIGIVDDSILFISPAVQDLKLGSTTQVVDADATFAIPGLWDMHAHLWDRDLLAATYLDYGITGVRDMGGTLDAWTRWEAEVDSVPLPRSVVAGSIVDGLQPVVFFYSRARDSTEGVERVSDLAERGSDFIKVYDRLGAEAFAGVVAEAKRRRIPFAGHVPVAIRASEALSEGMASIEHMTGIALECAANEDALRSRVRMTLQPFLHDSVDSALLSLPIDSLYTITRWEVLDRYDPAHCPALMQRLSSHNAWVTPTLVVTGESPERKAARVTPHLEQWPAWMRGMMRPSTDTARRRETETRLATLRRLFADLDAAGVRWLAGSDAPNPGSAPGIGLHHELELLVGFGLTPLEALQAATLSAAEFLGQTAVSGTLEAGKHADIVLLEANPLQDIRHTRDITKVVSRGRVVR